MALFDGGSRRGVLELHDKLAADVWRRGTSVTCDHCGYRRAITVTEFAQYLAKGWPRHCAHQMKVDIPGAPDAG